MDRCDPKQLRDFLTKFAISICYGGLDQNEHIWCQSYMDIKTGELGKLTSAVKTHLDTILSEYNVTKILHLYETCEIKDMSDRRLCAASDLSNKCIFTQTDDIISIECRYSPLLKHRRSGDQSMVPSDSMYESINKEVTRSNLLASVNSKTFTVIKTPSEIGHILTHNCIIQINKDIHKLCMIYKKIVNLMDTLQLVLHSSIFTQ